MYIKTLSMSFLRDDSHGSESATHAALTSTVGAVESSRGSHLIGAFLSFNFLDLFKSKYILSEIIRLYFLGQCSLEVGIANKQVEALLHLLLAHVLALLAEESEQVVAVECGAAAVSGVLPAPLRPITTVRVCRAASVPLPKALAASVIWPLAVGTVKVSGRFSVGSAVATELLAACVTVIVALAAPLTATEPVPPVLSLPEDR